MLRGVRFRQGLQNAKGVEGWDTHSQKFGKFLLEMLLFCCCFMSFEQIFNLTVKRHCMSNFAIALLLIDFIS